MTSQTRVTGFWRVLAYPAWGAEFQIRFPNQSRKLFQGIPVGIFMVKNDPKRAIFGQNTHGSTLGTRRHKYLRSVVLFIFRAEFSKLSAYLVHSFAFTKLWRNLAGSAPEPHSLNLARLLGSK